MDIRDKKLGEAERALNRLRMQVNDQIAFEDNLSSFLTAARSVLQYVFNELKLPGRRWYADYISGHNLLQLLSRQRNANIHRKPVDPLLSIETTFFAENPTAEIVGIDKNGNEIESTKKSSPPPSATPTYASESLKYFFKDTGSDVKDPLPPERESELLGLCQSYDVITLCEKWIGEIRSMLLDGRQKGFIK